MTPNEIATEICPGAPLDLGIARAVKVLRDAGIETYESCEGGPGHAYDRPTVRFHGGQAEGWRALTTCANYALPVSELGRVWTVIDGEPTGPYWQIVFRRKID